MRAIIGYLLLSTTFVTPCAALEAPVAAQITQEFAPIGAYAGHWGIDFGVDVGTSVGAAAAGRVTFAGSVAAMQTVTVDHGGGLKTSYSYLSSISVADGDWVVTGSILGTSGIHHDVPALHFSVRVDGQYRDPAEWLRCGGSIPDALRLAPA